MQAPNGKPTNLTAHQWVKVRTPEFKQVFGDWERKALKKQVDETVLHVTLKKTTAEIAEIIYNSLGEKQADYGARISRANKYDGLRIEFVKNIFGKLKGHNTRELIYCIIPELENIYANAVPIYFEPERNPKKSSNVVGFHNYLARLKDSYGGDYYVRVSVQELTRSWKKKEQEGVKQFHNVAISEIAIKSAAPSVTTGVNPPATTTAGSRFIDSELQKWFNSVNPSEVSTIVDENGEPLVTTNANGESVFVNSITGHEIPATSAAWRPLG